MTQRPFCPSPIRAAWLALAFAVLAGSRAGAQTPSSTWLATGDGVWSTGANWDTGAAPVPGATTTILQFNASGTTAYTATNDVADPFALLGIVANSSSTNPITLAGSALSISQNGGTAATTGFINQQGSGAIVINNALT